MIPLHLTAVDTWQFGVGIPSRAQSASQLTRATALSPSPATVAGALRAALARAHGWDGTGSWARDPGLVTLVGDGPEHFGATTFAGPLLTGDDTVLLPLPATVRQREDRLFAAVAPGGPVRCDLGAAVQLPHEDRTGNTLPEDSLMPVDDVRRLLSYEEVGIDRLVRHRDLWALEPRTAIERDPGRRTAAAGALFDVVHLRPRPGREPGLLMLASGDEERWNALERLVPLGAEGRLSQVSRWTHPCPVLSPDVASLEQIRRQRQATLLVVTPLLLDAAQWCGAAQADGLSGARLVCACGPRPVRLGGWDGQRRSPTPQRSFVAPGTVLFVAHDSGDVLAEALFALGPTPQIGGQIAAGFGLVMVGAAPPIGTAR